MAESGKVIKNKIRSVGNIKKITRTMEMVSVSKMRRAVERSTRSKYFSHLAYTVLATLSSEHVINHPFMESPKEATKELVILVCSNKGMAGGYNINLAKELREYIHERKVTPVLITIGKQAERIAKRFGCPVEASFTNNLETPLVEDVRSIKATMRDLYASKQYKSVTVITTMYIKTMDYQAVRMPLLPLSHDFIHHYKTSSGQQYSTARGRNAVYAYEPSLQRLADVVLPKLILSLLYQILLEASAAEHSSRMVAMKNATDNASSLMKELVLSYNKARQAAITQELSEIVGGANALD